ncbi:MAG TPA: cysteine peptidase family C39 domain-containing protein [Polyangiaceae bacterium]|nr:cysteine peptidase family C39 domain-containing protein [Polyangiaceae bacterium]
MRALAACRSPSPWILGLSCALALGSLGCAAYHGAAKTVQPSEALHDGDWTFIPHFPRVMQESTYDCGAASLAAVLRFWGKPTTPREVAALANQRGKMSAADLERAAKASGLSAFAFYGTMKDLVYELSRGRPVIVGLGKAYETNRAIAHYEVVLGWERREKKLLLLDPGRGFQVDHVDTFAKEWAVSHGVTVVAFLREGTPRTVGVN